MSEDAPTADPEEMNQWRVVADFGDHSAVVFQGIKRICHALAEQLPGTPVKSEDGRTLYTVKTARAEPFYAF